MTPEQLRTTADYHVGHDLVTRLGHVVAIVADKDAALRAAADEIERLTAELASLKGSSCATS